METTFLAILTPSIFCNTPYWMQADGAPSRPVIFDGTTKIATASHPAFWIVARRGAQCVAERSWRLLDTQPLDRALSIRSPPLVVQPRVLRKKNFLSIHVGASIVVGSRSDVRRNGRREFQPHRIVFAVSYAPMKKKPNRTEPTSKPKPTRTQPNPTQPQPRPNPNPTEPKRT